MPTYSVQWNLLNALDVADQHRDYGLIVADTADEAIDIVAERHGLANYHLRDNLDAFELPMVMFSSRPALLKMSWADLVDTASESKIAEKSPELKFPY
jgi:hypothetical protein